VFDMANYVFMGMQKEGTFIVHDQASDTRMFVSRDWLLSKYQSGEVTNLPPEVVERIGASPQVTPELPEIAKKPTAAVTYVQAEGQPSIPTKTFYKPPEPELKAPFYSPLMEMFEAPKEGKETIRKVGVTPLGGIIIERNGVRETIPPKAWEKIREEYYAGLSPEEKERQRMELIEAIQTQPFAEVAGKPYTIFEYFERETEAEKRARDPLAGFMYGISKPITLLPSLALAPFTGKEGIESVITYHKQQMLDIQRTLIYAPERRGEIALERVAEPAMLGLTLGATEVIPIVATKIPFVSKIPPVVGKVAITGISGTILGLGAYGFIGQAPKMVSPEITVERGRAIERGALGITGMFLGAYGVKRGWEALFPPKAKQLEFFGLKEEEVTPKPTIREDEGWISKKEPTEPFQRVMTRKDISAIFEKGKVMKETSAYIIKEYEGTQAFFYKKQTLLPKAKGELIDIAGKQTRYFGKFSGMDVFVEQRIGIPVSFEPPKAEPIKVFKPPEGFEPTPLAKHFPTTTAPTPTPIKEVPIGEGLSTMVKEAGKAISETRVTVPIEIAPPKIEAVLIPPIISPVFKEYQIQTTFPKQWEYTLPTLTLKTDVKLKPKEKEVKITPVEITVTKPKEEVTPVVAPLVTPFVGVTPAVTPITTPITTPIVTPEIAQITTPVTTPITPSPPPVVPVLPPILPPIGFPSGGFRRFRMPSPLKKGKQKTRYQPSLGGVLLGRRISRVPKRLFTGGEIRPVVGSKRIKKSKISLGFKRIKFGGKLKMAKRRRRKSKKRKKRR